MKPRRETAATIRDGARPSAAPGTASSLLIRIATIVGWALVSVFVVTVVITGGVSAHVGAFQFAYAVGFCGYLALIWAVWRGGGGGWGRWKWWVGGCIVLRAALLTTQPSDDLNRYLWEGRVQLAGFSPFVLAPDDPRLAHLRDDNWRKINHPDYSAIYPPLAQLEFAAAAALMPSVYTLKGLHVVADALVVVVLALCLRRMGRTPQAVVAYGLCPLVLTAFAIEGHVDSLMLLAAAAALGAAAGGRWVFAGAMLGAAVSAKLVFVVLLPWLALRHPRGAAAAVCVAAATYLPFVDGGAGQLAILARFAAAGEFFSLLGTFHVTGYDTAAARAVVMVVGAAVLIWLARRHREWVDFSHDACAALIILMPVVHYWYLTWVMLFMPFKPRARWIAAAWAMVTYFEANKRFYGSGQWEMPRWAPLAVWTAFLIAWGAELVAQRERSHQVS